MVAATVSLSSKTLALIDTDLSRVSATPRTRTVISRMLGVAVAAAVTIASSGAHLTLVEPSAVVIL